MFVKGLAWCAKGKTYVFAEKRNRKYCYRIPWNLPTSQFSCMILWLIHTSTNRLLHQGAAFWLRDQCRQRDKVLLQVGRLIEEEIDSWWWSGGWCIIVIVAMLPLSLLQCCQNCCIHGKQNWLAFQSPASTSATPPPRLRMDQPSSCCSYSRSVILFRTWDSNFISRFAMQGFRNTVSHNTRHHLPSSQLKKMSFHALFCGVNNGHVIHHLVA